MEVDESESAGEMPAAYRHQQRVRTNAFALGYVFFDYPRRTPGSPRGGAEERIFSHIHARFSSCTAGS
jgi:hypothetical protein